ncbi:MAG: hypothetical protein J0H73_13580 [Salana multivorans]|uniref:hypothetical protein n=1 Tax=Salana multivorans TaxID=120377 RepID=UPI0009678F96|nr:hypothetical protein [Salana multivorans]MBN8883331.1 hypothetical protein [Salana multivorans]OJX98418.1 MAG: hypothetical protein BGO96_04450 [Micrococcales bacterium 73-15]
MNTHIYVDETKAKGYLIVAATVLTSESDIPRTMLRDLVLPGQRSLHMNDERDSRRRVIADTIARMSDLGLHATIYDAGRRYRNEKERRAQCLRALVQEAALVPQASITFDRDDSLVSWDRQQMIELTRTMDTGDRIRYTHASRNTETLLAVPDAVAWCWARGGDWRRRVGPIIRDVRQV